MTLEKLIELGFDRSSEDSESGFVHASRSQCVAMTVNGFPVHERGCPNEKTECEECEAIIDRGNRLCDSCANPEPMEDDAWPPQGADCEPFETQHKGDD